MRIKHKILFYTSAILLVALTLGVGAFYLFASLGSSMDVMYREVRKDNYHDKLTTAARETVEMAESWVSKGDEEFRKKGFLSMLKVEEALSDVEGLYEDKSLTELLGNDVREFLNYAQEIFSTPSPQLSRRIEEQLELLRMRMQSAYERIYELHERATEATLELITQGQQVRSVITLYLTILVGFTILSSAFLLVFMRRMLEKSYIEMFDATEKVAGGDLSYRIHSRRRDEFGMISNRFDAMVQSLEDSDLGVKRKLKETELLLEVARLSGSMAERKSTLDVIVDTIAEKMDKDICGIFIYVPDKKAFQLESCNIDDISGETSLHAEASIARRAMKELKPFVLDEPGSYEELVSICRKIRAVLVAPIVRENFCSGLLMLGKFKPESFSGDELDTAMIVAHTISTALRNIELYEETGKQLRQLSVVYELSKALTSVYEPRDILDTITSTIVDLLNVRGCIIRLKDADGMLRVKSVAGSIERSSLDPLPPGKGIAGWVVAEQKSLFVEDISKIPMEMRLPETIRKSAIAVPLSGLEGTMGTLGLFDKLDNAGEIVSFSVDDLNLSKGFASISSIAIEKARMKEMEKRAEAEISETKKRMELIFESVQSGIVTVDRDYRITAANKYVERWVDKPLEEIINKNSLEVFHEKGGICPHCAARATFEEGGVNTITQSSGLNYADLASYPIKDEKGNVDEAVVFIQDITDRVLYQEEIMGLYREVMQSKEYIESLINNSADAIVTSDIDGIVKSWNPAAEEIYGFKKDEAVGKFLPFVPESLMELEAENIERIKTGEVLKLETFRKRADGTMIEVSLALSPIKDVTGEIIGISGISRDITEKKRVEKELIRRNQELSRLFFISSAMRGTLEMDRLLRMVLTAVTMSDGLGFNRAVLFMVDEDRNVLRGSMGVGPSSVEEAWKIWEELSLDRKTLHGLVEEIEKGPMSKDSYLDRICSGISIPLSDDTILSRAVKERKAYNVSDTAVEPLADAVLMEQLGTQAYAAVPLVSRNRTIGIMWVDNYFNRKPITDEDMKFLGGFADQFASAIEAARLFQQVSVAEAELENIFRSISDMVFITDKDYNISNANQAVVDRIGLPREQIISSKCYKIFHGMDEPWPACPHHKTMESMRSFVEELEDPHLNGTFLTSTSPMFDAENNFLGTVHVVRDISEIKQLREKLQSSERMAALGEVAAKVAHEIRNPLVSVGGFAKRLEDKLNGSDKEYAHIIANEVKRLEEILREILGFVREVRMSQKVVDLNSIVQEVLDLLDGEFTEKGNALIREGIDEVINVFVDPDRLKEALFNMVSNANQATDEGTVTVRTSVEDSLASLEISDTGCGIRKEDINRIFDPFFTTRPTGTGLGLAISKRIVEENDGSIAVESVGPGEGTTFKIYLPIKEVAHEQDSGGG